MNLKTITNLLFVCLSISLSGQVTSFEGKEVPDWKSEKAAKELQQSQVFQLDINALYQFLTKQTNPALKIKLSPNIEWDIQLYSTRHIASKGGLLSIAGRKGIERVPLDAPLVFEGIEQSKRGGEVRLTTNDGFLLASIDWNGSKWYIEPLQRFSKQAPKDYFLVYQDKHVKTESAFTCTAEKVGKLKKIAHGHQKNASPQPDCMVMELAFAADYALVTEFGGVEAMQNFAFGITNLIQSNYDDEFEEEIYFQISGIFVSICEECDPWGTETDSKNFLVNFSDWANLGNFGARFDIASLWSTRELDDGIKGIAWLGGLCNNRRYNVLRNFSTNAALLRVALAHEIGHNLDAGHDDEGSPTIMAPFVNNTVEWSEESRNVINQFIDDTWDLPHCLTNCFAPKASFMMSSTDVCLGGQISFLDNSENAANSWSWEFPGGTPSTSNLPNPKVRYDRPGVFPVTLIVSNDFGKDTLFKEAQVMVDFGGTNYLYYEDFEGDLNDWTIDNVDGEVTWELVTVNTGDESRQAAYINNFENRLVGESDAIISRSFDFSGQSSVQLELDYTYRRLSRITRNVLSISLSLDGGETFPYLVFNGREDGTGNFATGPPTIFQYFPSSSEDWCAESDVGGGCIAVDLQQFLGEPDVRIKIDHYQFIGNNMFIDNFRLLGNCEAIAPPVVTISSDATRGCVPFTVEFKDETEGEVDSRTWRFPGGSPSVSTEANPIITYNTPGSYSVFLEVQNIGGVSQINNRDYIAVLDNPESAFDFITEINVVNFDNLSTNYDSLVWEFGDGNFSSEVTPIHLYQQEGEFTVRLTTFNECGSSEMEQTIVISAPIDPGFTVETQSGCAPFTTQFFDTSEGIINQRFWIFEGGTPATSTEADPIVTYTQPGNYSVTLIVRNAINEETLVETEYINVENFPQASFEINYVPGSSTAFFVNTSENANSYEWSFGDGIMSNQQSPSYNYPSDGLYTVTLIANSPCGVDSISQQLKFITPPEARFFSSRRSGCAPMTVQYTTAEPVFEQSYIWIFEGGTPQFSNDPNPTVEYTTPGVFSVQLEVINEVGRDRLVREGFVFVTEDPQAGFETEIEFNRVDFENTSLFANTYLWNFGDGESSEEESPTHVYSQEGGYIVSLEIFNECGSDIFMDTIVIGNPLPEAMLPEEMIMGCENTDLQFFGQIQKADSIHWFFPGGIPETSNELEPVIQYAEPGIYDVVLEVFNAFGEISIIRDSWVEIQSFPQPSFEIQLEGNGVRLTNTTAFGISYLWDFGDGETSTEESPFHAYDSSGIYSIELNATNACGERSIIQTFSITVNSVEPDVVVSPNPTDGPVVIDVRGRPANTLEVRFLTIHGKTMLTDQIAFTTGEAVVQYVLDNFETGIYFVEFRSHNNRIQQKIIVR